MDKFKVGIIGYGWAATAHIGAINATGLAEVVAVYSSRELDDGLLSATHGSSIKAYRSIDALLAHPGLQVVDITSYPWEHAEQAVAAAAAGKHIILEKPATLSLEDLRRVETAVTRADVKLCVCFECRWSSHFLGIKAVLDKGLFGTVHYGEVDYYHGIGPWYGQFRWNITKKGGGSALLTAGCHALDALLLCMGGQVEEVMSYATKSKSAIFAPYEYNTSSVTILKFADGRVGKCAAVVDCLQPYYFHTHLVGSEGSILDKKFHVNLPGFNKQAWSEMSLKLLDSGDVSDHPYQSQFEAFFTALGRNEDMPLTGLADAVRSHEVIFAADRSAETGRPVRLAEVRG
ncbi:MAG: Gfo/Idh/MocA family protein [Verrucomicrobiales bacterium]